MSLVDLAFRRTSEDRNISFEIIFQTTQVLEVICSSSLAFFSPSQVEMLIMRAISLGLLRGTIDEVDHIFSVTWVQPRILNIAQITEMGERIEKVLANPPNSLY